MAKKTSTVSKDTQEIFKHTSEALSVAWDHLTAKLGHTQKDAKKLLTDAIEAVHTIKPKATKAKSKAKAKVKAKVKKLASKGSPKKSAPKHK